MCAVTPKKLNSPSTTRGGVSQKYCCSLVIGVKFMHHNRRGVVTVPERLDKCEKAYLVFGLFFD